MKSDFKLVIFDLDGTLVDAFKAVTLSLNHALSSCGLDEVDDELVKRNVGWGEKVLVERFVDKDKSDEVLSIYRIHHAKALRSGTKFLPYAKETLHDLKAAGYRLAVASNRPSRFTHIILKQLQIKDLFDCVVCADQVGNPKPAGDVLHEVIKRCRVTKDEALYVGDMSIDIETAKNAGVACVGVLTGSHKREELAAYEPDELIDSMDGLKRAVKALVER